MISCCKHSTYKLLCPSRVHYKNFYVFYLKFRLSISLRFQIVKFLMFTNCSAVEPVSEGNAPFGWWIIRWLLQPSPPLNPPSCQWCHPIFYPLNINFPNSQLLMDHPGNLIHRAALSVCLLVVHQNAAKSKLVVQHGQRHNNWSFWKFWLDCLRDCFHKNSLLERDSEKRYCISDK